MPTDTAQPVEGLQAPNPDLFRGGRTALFLDIDGTLASFQKRPELVGPDPALTALLTALSTYLEGRLAVVSGRTLGDIDRIVEGAVAAAAGVHGLERRRADGVVHRLPPHPGLPEAEAAFLAFADAHPGVVVETKGMSAALHFRGAPAAASAAETLARRVGAAHGLTVQEGAMVVELRTPGADKGDALIAFMSESPFNGAQPVMIGDDLTDEVAFAAAAGLGGFGILVGPPRATKAHYRLADVPDVLDFIAAIVGPLETQRASLGGKTSWRA